MHLNPLTSQPPDASSPDTVLAPNRGSKPSHSLKATSRALRTFGRTMNNRSTAAVSKG
jgi:hypothetical protein